MLRRDKTKFCLHGRTRRAQSLIEYIVLIVIILGAFLVFQKYIARGFAGRWKSVGESFGQGRNYDPRLTMECVYDFRYTNRWYNQACYKERGCDCLTVRQNSTTCRDCIQQCFSARCD